MNRSMLKSLIFLFAAVLYAPLAVHASTLTYNILDASTNDPVVNVRITFLNGNGTCYSDTNGVACITTAAEHPTLPDLLNFLLIDTSHLVGTTASIKSSTSIPSSIIIFDLSGKVVHRAGDYSSLSTIPPYTLSPGIYLIGSRNGQTSKMLVNRSYQSRYSFHHKSIFPDTPRDIMTNNDSLIFFKAGYVPVILPFAEASARNNLLLHKKKFAAFDLHNHTVLTDGSQLMDSVCSHAFKSGGLDVLVNSEHGGCTVCSRDTLGIDSIQPGTSNIILVPRWHSLVTQSWPKILSMRKRFPGKTILLGLEWNCPGHEHASVGFIDDADQPQAISRFEYMFDSENRDLSIATLPSFTAYEHKNALEALRWLETYYPASSYCFVNHPSREASGVYTISDFRDFHNAAPHTLLGFEGLPGHQNNTIRGSYDEKSSSQNRTWGGADIMLAEIGGKWDALLGEGRRIFSIVNSDFHHIGPDYFPGEYAKTWVAVRDTGAKAWLDGVKSGDMFTVHGNLITALEFNIDDGRHNASMGSELHTDRDSLLVNIIFSVTNLFNGHATPMIDHIDLISGAITGTVDSSSPAYSLPLNSTTSRIFRFTSDNWTMVGPGKFSISQQVSINRSTYFRLRGTNLAPDTNGETDKSGNPLVDEEFTNTPDKTWNDLWFYSNPLFVYYR